ncbi:MAG: hydrogenase maturation nickel metallochaperone HypA [Bacteroidales bacterium]|nr:hydrogenase maturation nickel metallochaperone HypA [Bacteroidales bacterium]
MHELSIALSIVELAEEEARKADAISISKVELEIGTMAGIETDALLFAWDSVVQGTMAQQSQLVIHTVEAEAHCLECGKDFPAEHFFVQCPHCNSFRYQITKGKELRISSLLVD